MSREAVRTTRELYARMLAEMPPLDQWAEFRELVANVADFSTQVDQSCMFPDKLVPVKVIKVAAPPNLFKEEL